MWAGLEKIPGNLKIMWDITRDSALDLMGFGNGNSMGGKSLSDYLQTDSEKEKRKKLVAGLTLSSDPAVAAIQKQAQAEYIATGLWNPKYTDEANGIRDPLGLSSGSSGMMIVAGVVLLVLLMRR